MISLLIALELSFHIHKDSQKPIGFYDLMEQKYLELLVSCESFRAFASGCRLKAFSLVQFLGLLYLKLRSPAAMIIFALMTGSGLRSSTVKSN